MSHAMKALESVFLLPSPLQNVDISCFTNREVSLYIKRDDLIHPLVSGNKWRKLKYNIFEAISSNLNQFVTFGGAFSNHLVAVAVVAHTLQMPVTGFVRGYHIDENNPTIQLLRKYHMQLILVDPKEYRLKEEGGTFLEWSHQNYDYLLIPEGGTNELAVNGVRELGQEIQMEFSHTYLGIGTAGTLAGVVTSDLKSDKIIGVSPFAGSVDDLAGFQFIEDWCGVDIVQAKTESRFGAFDNEVADFIITFYNELGIILDPVYTGPAMIRLLADIKEGVVQEGSKVLFIHTGGLQGNFGYNYRYASKMNHLLPEPSLVSV